MNRYVIALAAAIVSAAASLPASAQVERAAPVMSKPVAGIDAATFIPGHPASPTWKAPAIVRANGEHPAVLVSRQPAHIDSNTFIVQPPASTAWTSAPADLAVVAGSPANSAR
uniref:hypothetical protein n=1 Tax=uncultured Aquincola sp. TaxID=886556 RepID=UPI0032B0F38C